MRNRKGFFSTRAMLNCDVTQSFRAPQKLLELQEETCPALRVMSRPLVLRPVHCPLYIVALRAKRII